MTALRDLPGNRPLPDSAAFSSNNVPVWDGAAWVPASAFPPNGAAGGDTAGTFPNPTVRTGIFRDGADGAATLDGTATVTWATLVGSTYTMTRDCACTSLTINGGVTLKPAGYRIFVQGTLSNAGTIDGNGNDGLADGTIGAGISLMTISGAGGAGNVGAGGVGVGVVGTVGGGNAGGLGSSGAGGAAPGQQFNNAALVRAIYGTPVPACMGGFVYASTFRALAGGSGGGGGGGDGVIKGGGGGSGAIPVIILARTLTNTGTIRSNGGAGGSPASGNTGGGGGGGGGLVAIYTTSAPMLGTITVTGGTGGTKQGTGVNGSTGSVGQSLNIVLA